MMKKMATDHEKLQPTVGDRDINMSFEYDVLNSMYRVIQEDIGQIIYTNLGVWRT